MTIANLIADVCVPHTEQLIPKFRQTQHIPTLNIGTSLRYLPHHLDVVQAQGIVRQLYHVAS